MPRYRLTGRRLTVRLTENGLSTRAGNLPAWAPAMCWHGKFTSLTPRMLRRAFHCEGVSAQPQCLHL